MEISLAISNIFLWILLLGLALTVFALARQIGVLHERIAPAGALMVAGGPKVGEQAPVLTVSDIEGNKHSVGAVRGDGKSVLIFFLSPGCPVCKTLLPVLKSAQWSERQWLEIVLASDGELEEQLEFVKQHELSSYVYLLSEELGLAYRVGKLPYALIIDEKGILRGKGIVNSREHIESLIEAKIKGVATIQEYISSKHHP